MKQAWLGAPQGLSADLLGEADELGGLVGGSGVWLGVEQPGADDGEDAHEDGGVGVLGSIARDEQYERLQEELLAVGLHQHLVGRQLERCQRRPRQRPVLRLPHVAALPAAVASQMFITLAFFRCTKIL